MSEKLNPKDIYAIDIEDPDKYADVENKAGVYAALITLALVGQIALIKSCTWYVVLSYLLEAACCIPVVASFVVFMFNKDKFMALIYDLTYGAMDKYSLIMLIGAAINLVVALVTSTLVSFSLNGIIVGLFAIFFIIMARSSQKYVNSITWRIRHYLGKKN